MVTGFYSFRLPLGSTWVGRSSTSSPIKFWCDTFAEIPPASGPNGDLIAGDTAYAADVKKWYEFNGSSWVQTSAGLVASIMQDLSGDVFLVDNITDGQYLKVSGSQIVGDGGPTPSWASITGKPTTLSGYGITDAQPLDADLTAIAALTTTSFGRGFLTLADAAAARTLIGAGTGSGTVTSITAGAGLTGGTITGSGTIALAARTFTSFTPTLNSAVQYSATRDVFLAVSVDIGCTLTLTGGQTGAVTLQYADDSGMSTNLVTVGSTVNGNTGTLTIGLSLTQTATGSVSGIIPAGKYARISTTNTTGTPTFTARASQRVDL